MMWTRAIRYKERLVLGVSLGAIAVVYTLALLMGSRGTQASPDLGSITSITYERTDFMETRRILPPEPILLHERPFKSHGGLFRIEWYSSDLEPTKGVQGRAIISLYVDDVRRASMIKGQHTGTYEDGPVRLIWLGELDKGAHLIDVRLDEATNHFGIPYTDPGKLGQDTLIAEELTVP